MSASGNSEAIPKGGVIVGSRAQPPPKRRHRFSALIPKRLGSSKRKRIHHKQRNAVFALFQYWRNELVEYLCVLVRRERPSSLRTALMK
jgi:hypothetical protein